MGVNIHVKPTEVWKFFDLNKSRLANEMVAIAENEETEHAVYLTEEKGLPLLSVYRDNQKLYEEGAVSEDDCTETAKKLYVKYLFPVVIDASSKAATFDKPKYNYGIDEDDDLPDDTRQEREDEMYEREDALLQATYDFLEVFLSTDRDDIDVFFGEDVIPDFIDNICEMLATEYGVSVYRPMFITDPETGSEIYTEYPYLDIDDEDTLA